MPIKDVNAVEQYTKDYREYAEYVITQRVTPEFRDGLRPVQRRIIYAAYCKCGGCRTMTKCATIVGATIGSFHPHGDSACYGALCTMINWFNSKCTFFDGQGNFGNTNGDSAAHMRYPEAKLNNFTYDIYLDELISCRETVNWQDNFSRSEKEPKYFPAKVPMTLVNGASYMAVGKKIDIPTHNLGEVIDATIHLLRHPKAQITLIPDHCQRCEIVNTDWDEISKNGFGHYTVRGIIEVGTYNGAIKSRKGYPTLALRSCPNQTYMKSIIDKIKVMIKTNKIIGVVDIEEQSKENDRNVVLVLKPGTDPNFIRDTIYKNTPMSQTARVDFVIFNSEDRSEPIVRTSYTEYLRSWIAFRKITKVRYFQNKLQEINTKIHKVGNYIWAIESGTADTAIQIIKKYKGMDENELVELLIKKLKITDLQAQFFINAEIKKLSRGYLDKFKEDLAKLEAQAKYCRDSVLIDGRLEQIIIDELQEIKRKYATPRLCRVIEESEASGIPAGDFKVIITEKNFIKKIGVMDKIIGIKNDNVKFVVVGDNSKNLLLFDSVGKVYNLPISKVPFCDGGGIDIRLINKYINANITSVIYEPIVEKFSKGSIITLSKSGLIKRMEISDFLAVPPSGLVYAKLDQNDSIIDIMLFNGNADIVVYSASKALKMSINEIPLLKRNTKGNISMGGTVSSVEGLSAIQHNTSSIIVITSKGYFNKVTPEVLKTGRAKAGGNVIKLLKGDSIVSVLGVNEQNVLSCITTANGEIVEVPVSSIPLSSTASSGTRIINAKYGTVAKVKVK